MLEVKNLSKSYHSVMYQTTVLNNINFILRPKEFISIQGSSGTGKSTLMNLVAGLEKPSSGDILLHNSSIFQLYKSYINRYRYQYIGLIFQNHFLIYNLTVLENILLPLRMQKKFNKKEATEKCMGYLQKVGLDHRCHYYPSQISGGESQRVAIIRAIIHEPAIILADEPTGNLDEENTTKFIDILLKLLQDHHSSLVLVTHDKSLAQLADIQYLLSNHQLNVL